jgi:hypothetical protein
MPLSRETAQECSFGAQALGMRDKDEKAPDERHKSRQRLNHENRIHHSA